MNAKRWILLLTGALLFSSCNSPVSRIFKKKETPHEAYASAIQPDSVRNEWKRVAATVVEYPVAITVPYRHIGYFPNDTLRAIAVSFTITRGERLNVQLTEMDTIASRIYMDIYQKDSTSVIHVMATDTGDYQLSYDATNTGTYLLRLQPRLEKSGFYQLYISKEPSLSFPVAGKRSVGSRWGAERDGGARSHEGIDIPAPRNTPALAAADGIISRVQNGGLGGKTVSIRTEKGNLSLYYAHLDSQLVRQGQRVRSGDTIGLVGNTGNAITTGPHLHFGIYTSGGAVDPFPFVNKNTATLADLPAQRIPAGIRLASSFKTGDAVIAAKSVLRPLAKDKEFYLVVVNDRLIKVPGKLVTVVKDKE
jgi:murein DD-endopeptidase MepM/ murein hydrolase activator NlpD